MTTALPTRSVIAVCALSVWHIAAAQDWPSMIDSRRMMGSAPGDFFGTSVAMIGDFNGDGLGDWAIGAPYADLRGSASGAVYVFYGAPPFGDTVPDLILAGEATDDHFGISVSGGDLDADGFADIVVGARFNDRGATDGGAVFIFRGGPSPSSAPARVLAGENADDWFGQSVSFAGDVNGDGFGDIIVGAPYNDATANAAGRAYVYFGGSPLPIDGWLPLAGPAQANAHFGWSVAGVGDVNTDGRGDVLVGARLFGAGPNRARGRAYLYLGANPMDAVPDRILDGAAPDDWFGQCVAGVGDVNADGFDDFAVGAIYSDTGGSAAGSVSVFLGGASLPVTPAVVILGTDPDAQGGGAIAGGDIDGDGLSDIFVGVHFADTPSMPAAGAALVVFGRPVLQAQPDLTLFGLAAHDHLGESLSRASIVTPIGLPAFLVGANMSNAGGTDSGEAWVIRLLDCGTNLDGDGVLSVDDLYSWYVVPRDLNRDGATNDEDNRCLHDILRREERQDLMAGRW